MRDPGNTNIQKFIFDEPNDEHFLSSIETPLREDAFKLDDELKIELIENKFKDIMEILGLDLTDESLERYTKASCKNVCKRNIQRFKSGKQAECYSFQQ
jgi:GTP cyclohydrolase I